MAAKPERITIGSKSYRKFIPYPSPVRDGTVRCFACGQIDEPALHEVALCPACPEFHAGRLALAQHQAGEE